MAIYCIDYINGVNTPGGGTAGAPWKSIEYAQTQITVAIGDEFRIQEGVAPTLLSSTAFQTAASSFVITTGVNLTGSLAAGDYIFLGSDLVQVYRIASITSTQITVMSNAQLYPEYMGANVTFEIWKAGGVPVPIAVSGDALDTINATTLGAINSDSVIISGGWNSTFSAKTTFGKTFFYRTGTLGPTSNIPAGNIFKMSGGGIGWVLKDFNTTGCFSSFLVNLISTTISSKTDNIVVTTYSNANFITSGFSSTSSEIYHTNMTVVITSDTAGRVLTLYSSTFTSEVTQKINLDNLVFYITGRVITNARCSIRFNPLNQSNYQLNLGNLKIVNRFNYLLWGSTDTNQPDILYFSTLPTNDNNFVNYIKIDSLDIQGYNIQLFQTSLTPAMRMFVPLSSGNLTKIDSIGLLNRTPRVVTISAPGSPFSTATGNFIDPDQDSIANMGVNSTQPTIWKDTLANLDYYIYSQAICYLDTTNYSTGTNSLAVRPGSIGTVGTVYGFSVPAGISFLKKNSQIATITIKMKLLGTYGTLPTIKLQSALTNSIAPSYQSPPTGFSATNGINLLPSTNPNTSTWTDVVYTLPASTTTPGDLVTGFNFVLYEGENGSNLAEAGKWLLIDSVTITLS